jgi:hypothetical protein
MRIIEGNVDLANLTLTELPDLSDVIVTGDFRCYRNLLTSLVGSPREVKGSFWCPTNRLTSLEGAPTKVGRDFLCYDNPKKFTEEEVRAVCKVRRDVIT